MKALIMVFAPNHSNFKFLETDNEFEPDAYQMVKWICSCFKPGKVPKYKYITKILRRRIILGFWLGQNLATYLCSAARE
jgi:hypothetical protein